MEQTVQVPQEPKSSKTKSKLSAREPKKKMRKTRSFTDALREKYCSQDDCDPYEFIIDIVIRGKPRNNGPTSAELAHLRNVVSKHEGILVFGRKKDRPSSKRPADLHLFCAVCPDASCSVVC